MLPLLIWLERYHKLDVNQCNRGGKTALMLLAEEGDAITADVSHLLSTA